MALSLSTVASLASDTALSIAVNEVCAVVMSVPNAVSVRVGVVKSALPVSAFLMNKHCWMVCKSVNPFMFCFTLAIGSRTGDGAGESES